jgi:hypothetical protein
MKRKYTRRSKALVNLSWIDETAQTEIFNLWDREEKETRPPGPILTKGYDNYPELKRYSFGRETQRYHGTGLSYNYVSLTVDLHSKYLRVRATNYASGLRNEIALPLNALPRDLVAFYDLLKERASAASADTRVFSFNRKAIEETWESLLGAIALLPRYEIDRMHEISGWDA